MLLMNWPLLLFLRIKKDLRIEILNLEDKISTFIMHTQKKSKHKKEHVLYVRLW